MKLDLERLKEIKVHAPFCYRRIPPEDLCGLVDAAIKLDQIRKWLVRERALLRTQPLWPGDGPLPETWAGPRGLVLRERDDTLADVQDVFDHEAT